MTCETCNKPIPETRLRVLPDTRTCVSCSKSKRVKGHQVTITKGCRELEIVDGDYEEPKRRGYGTLLR